MKDADPDPDRQPIPAGPLAREGFQDRLGASRFTAGMNTPNDEAAAAILAHFFEQANRVSRGQVNATAR